MRVIFYAEPKSNYISGGKASSSFYASWSMHVEACTHHDDIINNILIGQKWVGNVAGVVATIVDWLLIIAIAIVKYVFYNCIKACA